MTAEISFFFKRFALGLALAVATTPFAVAAADSAGREANTAPALETMTKQELFQVVEQLMTVVERQRALLEERLAEADESEPASHQDRQTAASAPAPPETTTAPLLTDPETREDLEGEDLDLQNYLPSRSWAGGTLHYGSETGRIAAHGFVDLEYVDPGSDGSRGGVPTFDNHHANFFLTGKLSDRVTAHAEFEFEHGGDSVETDQAFVSVRAKQWFHIDAGRFYTPFGIERFVWYSPINQMVSRPLAQRLIVPGNFYGTGLKISGLLLKEEAARLTYEVSLTNGLGEAAATNRRDSRESLDNNSDKAITGRIGWLPDSRLEVGASFHTQKYDRADELDLIFLGLDLSARWQGFELRAEAITAKLDRAEDGQTLPDLEQRGWYSQLAYTWLRASEVLPSLTLIGRIEGVDLDRSTRGNDDVFRFSVGANAEVFNHVRAKLEYQWLGESGATKNDDAFLAQATVDF